MIEPSEKISILYLDDEENNLTAFKAGFRRKHNIRLALTAEDAFRQLKDEQPQIIIADQRMPGLSGVEFFEKVKVDYPAPIRILLTAYSGSQTVIDGVNRGNIDKYMLKPWDNAVMESVLQTGLSMYKAKTQINQKNEELRRVNEELNRFVYSVSHDLRAPLMSVLGLIGLSRHETDPDELNRYFELMESSVKKMDHFIQSTLEYYRNFKANLPFMEVDALELVREITEALSNYSRFLHFKIDAPDDNLVYTDRTRLKIALSNLISNAAKYGKKENFKDYEVRIGIQKSANGIIITVADDGVGISKQELSGIFDMFYKTPGNNDVQSTGLGLYLVNEAVQKINGTIDIESELNEGTNFTVKIPDMETV